MKSFFKKIALTGIITFIPMISFGQHWQTAGNTCAVSDIGFLLTDTINNRVYCSGNYIAPGCPAYNPGVAHGACYGYSYWDGNTWTSIGDSLPANNDQRPLYIYQDTLFSSLFYLNYSQQNPSGSISYNNYIGKWSGGVWTRIISDSTDGVIGKFKEINGKLYAAGWFNRIGGVKACNIAYKDSLGWHALDSTTWSFNYGFTNIEEYNGSIYVCGNFHNSSGSISRMAKWDGAHWNNVGGTMFNQTYDGAYVLCKYNGYLYAGGGFNPTTGDPGWNIARWNDTAWSQLGSGITDSSFTGGQVLDMKIINGKLVIAGGFNFANGISANNIVEWDGSHFCSFGGTFDNLIYRITGFGNEIIVTGPNHIYDPYVGDTIAVCNVARWTGGNYRESCSAGLGIQQHVNNKELNVYPNPALNSLSVYIDGIAHYQNSTIIIQNTLGQTVKKLSFTNNVDVSTLQQGCYFIQVALSTGEIYEAKFIKQ